MQVFRFEEICPSDQVLKALNKLKSTKATGLDDVTPSMIKDASQYIVVPVAYIINLSMSSGIYPAQWKNAKIIPVYKSGSVSELDNYCPISILPAISKIAERLDHDQLAKFLEDSSLLSPTQFGFRYFTDTIMIEIRIQLQSGYNQDTITDTNQLPTLQIQSGKKWTVES